ncbi:hypothetical protein [Aquimarina muelleri]|uniref:Transmembrane protein n=1 Tax=Aquimarina muelleri TaxID=279356 RepID=A0A918JUM8_9FLAO|nr:hypothetical protein [Aquimarina muelleri]MCX2761388.1 hypothetical protein [Aquimarina muelleri]GGX13293.1 hypothetical protein GCM10007384_13600 [Aquimarina muelleri]
MNFFLRSISYILHPLLMPILGAIIYFSNAPRFISSEIITAKILGLITITLLMPIVLFFLLKNLGIITSIHLRNSRERKIPLLLQSILFIIVIKMVINIYHYPELYFFYLGILFSSLSAIFMIFFNIKASLHMIGVSSITIFTILLSIHFELNLIILISILFILNGLSATSRLHYKAHTSFELILGILIGTVPQITLANLWL